MRINPGPVQCRRLTRSWFMVSEMNKNTNRLFRDLMKGPIKYTKAVVRTARGLHSGNFNFVTTYPPGHFYSPIPDWFRLEKTSSDAKNQKKSLLHGIEINDDKQIQLVSTFESFYKDMPIPVTRDRNFRFYLDNDYFSFGDSVILYSILRQFRPKQIIEVGSGFSSALMLDICDRFAMNDTKLTFIDPFPDRLNRLLGPQDKDRCTVIAKNIQDVDCLAFDKMEFGDIVFIDSSHVAKYKSDVLHVIFEILPVLKEGVLIQFHDIPWPFEYPDRWLKAGRAWNEAYYLRAFLQGNVDFEILYFNSYMEQLHADLFEATMPLILRVPSFPLTLGNSSLWLRARGVRNR